MLGRTRTPRATCPNPRNSTKSPIDTRKGVGQPGIVITSIKPFEEEDDSESSAAQFGVADWRDTSRFPTLCRELLEEASGITIPSSDFVLKVILAYLIAVVPLNWLICRFVLNRREWAWVVVPLVALGFAIAVQRVASYDVGFDSASDEIDVLEIQGEYHRAHLSRFASLYTNGRGNYNISYPNNNSALTLPLDNGRSIRGEDVTTSIWQSSPVPELVGPGRPAAEHVAVPVGGAGDPGRLDPHRRLKARSVGSSTRASWNFATRP